MKKLFVAFSLAFMMLAVMTSCGSSTSSPSEVALAATKCMQEKDFSGYVDLTDADSGSKSMMVSMISEKATQQMDSKGGITNFAVQSEEIADDGQTAVVKMNITYGNGDTEVSNIKCVNKDGKWLVSKDK